MNPFTSCVYRYDPLDRLASSGACTRDSVQCFYRENRLTTQIQGVIRHSLLHERDYLLARQSRTNGVTDCALLATDRQDSVIAAQGHLFCYTPYGHRPPLTNPTSLPGFGGQQLDSVTGHYLLGNGYRAFNPVLMRFNSPDRLSPFGEGGLNAYAYCVGDPVNRMDPTGHTPAFLKAMLRAVGIMKKARSTFGRSNIVDNAAAAVQKSPPLTKRLKLGDRTELDNGIYMYDGLRRNDNLELVINAHGVPPSASRGPRLVTKDKRAVSPRMLKGLLEQNAVDLNLYERIHLISCYSANGGDISFAAKLSHLTQKPVKGYRGVTAVRGFRNNPEDYNGPPEVFMTNPFDKKSIRGQLFRYEPVWFP